MDGNDTSAFGTAIGLFLRFQKQLQAVLTNKLAVFHKARPIPSVIAFFKAFYPHTGVIGAFKTVSKPFYHNAFFYRAFTAVFRLAHIAVQAAGTRLFVITVPIADQTVHSAGSKQIRINIFFWHLHCAHSPVCVRSLCLQLYHISRRLKTVFLLPGHGRQRIP